MDPADADVSPRVANPMIGLGLLEAIDAADILAHADPDDADGDGISGRPSSSARPGDRRAGARPVRLEGDDAFDRACRARRPSPATSASPPRIVTDAFGECSVAQSVCRDMPSGVQPRLGEVEAPDPVLPLVTFYAQNLAVPARRDIDDPAGARRQGRLLRRRLRRTATRPSSSPAAMREHPEQRFQLIWPYTDMLLHDMGEGLADGRPVGDASGTEWRTAPLWGIGLTEVVNGNTFYLHDGRAHSLLEAILWHGGEAQAARDAVVAMPPAERAALLRFLELR